MRLTSYPTAEEEEKKKHSSNRGAIKRNTRTLDTEIIAIIMLLNVHISICVMCSSVVFVQSPKLCKAYYYLHFCTDTYVACKYQNSSQIESYINVHPRFSMATIFECK